MNQWSFLTTRISGKTVPKDEQAKLRSKRKKVQERFRRELGLLVEQSKEVARNLKSRNAETESAQGLL